MVTDIKADKTKWTTASTSFSFLYSSSFLFPSLSWCLNTSCDFEQILLHLFWVLMPNKTIKIDHLIMIPLCNSTSPWLLSAIFRVSIFLFHPFVLVIHIYTSLTIVFELNIFTCHYIIQLIFTLWQSLTGFMSNYCYPFTAPGNTND